MTEPFPVHTEDTAPEASKPALAATKASFGMIPNLERVMAASPELLEGHNAVWDLFDRTTLSPIERQVVYLTANFENECDYCVPWHSLLAEKAGMAPADLEALRTGGALTNPKLDALAMFTSALIANRGKVSLAEREAFFAAGYTPRQALEVILGLAVKTISNYTNSVAGTPLDAQVQSRAWHKPKVPMRAA